MKASSDNRVIPFAINGQAEAKEMGKAVLSSSSSVAHLPAPIKVYRRKLRRRRQIIQEAFDIFDLDRYGIMYVYSTERDARMSAGICSYTSAQIATRVQRRPLYSVPRAPRRCN